MTIADREERRFRLAVLDVDGTLLQPSGKLSDRVRDAVLAAYDAGCLVTLASGRRLWAIKPIVKALGISAPVILYNGAIVYDIARDEAIVSAHLEDAPFQSALDLLWEHGVQPVVFGHPLLGELVYTGPAGRDTLATAHYFDRPTSQPWRLELSELRRVQQPPLIAAIGKEVEMRALEGAALAAGLDCDTLVERQSFVPRSAWWQLDLSAKGCSKGAALFRLCELYGIAAADTLAIGDGINDLDLIQSAGFGVAMGNAVPEVLAAASASVADNASDGAAEAIERFILGESVCQAAIVTAS